MVICVWIQTEVGCRLQLLSLWDDVVVISQA